MRRFVIIPAAVALVWAGRLAAAPATRPAATSQASSRSRPAAGDAGKAPSGRETYRRRLREARMARELMQLFEKKKFSDAKKVAEGLVKLNPKSGMHWYNLACANSRLGRPDLAVSQLAQAVERGYDDMKHMERDPDLEALHDVKGFKEILARRDEIHRERAEERFAALTKRFTDDYIVEIDHKNKLVFATNIDRPTLEALRDELTRQAAALWDELFANRFERYVTVIIPKPGTTMPARHVAGFYNPMDNALVARSIGMVLRHEFTHALHFGDQRGRAQQHPTWVLEGLATLYENSRHTGGRLVPIHSGRLRVVQQLVKRNQAMPLGTLMKLSHLQFVRHAQAAYAMSRYFMMYLHQRGKLRAWYDAYTSGYEQDRTGIRAVEKVLGKKLADVQADWQAWVARQEAPDLYVGANQPYMGISSRPSVDGLLLSHVVPGSGADRAGLKRGDLIVRINGEKTVDRSDMLRQVTAGKVGEKLKVTYRRDNELHETNVELTPKSKDVDRTIPQRPVQPLPAGRDKAKDSPGSQPAGKAPADRPSAKGTKGSSSTSRPTPRKSPAAK